MVHVLAFLQQEIESGVIRIDTAPGRDLVKGHADQIRIGLGVHENDLVPMARADQSPHGTGVSPDSFPCLVVLQTPGDALDPSLLGPLRQKGHAARVRPVMWYHVERDIHAVAARLLAHLDRMLHGMVGRTELWLDVRNLEPRFRHAGGRQSLAKTEVIEEIAVADVSCVEDIVLGRDLGHVGELIRGCKAARPILKPARKTEGPSLDALLQEGDHLVHLVLVGRPQRVAQNSAMDCPVPDERQDIDAKAHPVEMVEIIAEGQPVDIDGALGETWRHQRDIGAISRRRAGDAALSDDLGRDSLMNLAFRAAVGGQSEVGMGVEINEAWRNRQAPGLKRRVGLALNRSDFSDPAVTDADIGIEARPPGAVDDVAALYDDIQHGWLPFYQYLASP